VLSSTSSRMSTHAANKDMVQDEDIYVLGDDEDDEEETQEVGSVTPSSGISPPAYQSTFSSSSSLTSESTLISQTTNASTSQTELVVTGEQLIPSKYYINPKDTLQGIALRYGINVRHTASVSVITNMPHYHCERVGNYAA
jgi:LysM repeat protein